MHMLKIFTIQADPIPLTLKQKQIRRGFVLQVD